MKYSHKNVSELILYHLSDVRFKLLPEELESFFISWTNRIPTKSLSLVIVNYDENNLNTNEENMKIIKKYTKLGIIKKFKVAMMNIIKKCTSSITLNFDTGKSSTKSILEYKFRSEFI